MLELLGQLAKRSGKSLDEVKKLFQAAKKSVKAKGHKQGSVNHTQLSLKALKEACAEKPQAAPAESAKKAKSSNADKS
jgi:hypothetical protein